MAQLSSSDVFKIVEFDYEHKIFTQKGDLKPQSFKFVTAEENEFSYTWQVKYTVNKYETIYTEQHQDADSLVDSEFIDALTDEAPPCTKLTDIDFSLKEKLSMGDNVYLTLKIRGFTVFLNAKYGAGTMSLQMTIPDCINEWRYSRLDIKVNVYHRYNKHYEQVIDDLSRFLDSQALCDVKFMIDGIEIPAHKQILSARNPVFRSMFETDMLEREHGRVEITDVQPGIFKHLLRFIYTGKVDSNGSAVDWLKLTVAGDKYGMTSLVSLCIERLSADLNVHGVIDVFNVADSINIDTLKEMCKKYIHANKREVVSSEGYRSLIESRRADLISELFCFDLVEKK